MQDYARSDTEAARLPRTRFSSRKLRNNVAGYTLITPLLVLLTYFYFVPLILTIVNSMYSFNLTSPEKKQFVGMGNFEKLMENGDFQIAVWHTIVYTAGTVFFSTVISLCVAVLLNRKIWGRSIYRTIYFLPVVAPTVATSIVFMQLFANDNSGAVNQTLSLVNMEPIAWLGDPKYAMASVVIYGVWTSIGFNMVIYLAGLQGISESYYEAARLEGANGWVIFRKITVPLLGPTTLFVVVVGVLGAFQVFNQIYIMTGGGPLNATTVIVYYIYQAAVQNYQGGTASAMSTILFVILFLITLAQIKLFARNN